MLLAGLCALALVAVGLAWSLASPAGSSPDDDFHLASIWCATGDPAVCRRTGEEIEEGVERVHVLRIPATDLAEVHSNAGRTGHSSAATDSFCLNVSLPQPRPVVSWSRWVSLTAPFARHPLTNSPVQAASCPLGG